MKIDSVKVLGPFNSGTNLMTKIIKHISDITDDQQPWKHTVDEKLLEEEIKNRKNTLFVCMYKPIYNWIESMKKTAYDIKWNNKVNRACVFNSAKISRKRRGSSCYMKNNGTYNNIVEIYNRYYLMYKILIENNNNIVWIDYYSLLDNQKYVIDKLEPFLPIIRRDYTQVLLTPCKRHGHSVKNANDALVKKAKVENLYHESEDKIFIDNILNDSIVHFFNIN